MEGMTLSCIPAILGLLLVFAGMAQSQAPCYTCELFKIKHPQTKVAPIDQQVGSKHTQRDTELAGGICNRKCWCADAPLSCLPGVVPVRDGCGCCMVCPRQKADHCDDRNLCDSSRNLTCLDGLCAVKNTSHRDCFAGGEWYKSGLHYQIGCQRICTCNNGYFVCSNLCSHENTVPLSCPNARLVRVGNRCCKEWLCDRILPQDNNYPTISTHHDKPTGSSDPGSDYCEHRRGTDWTACSTSCGWGQSIRYRDKRCDADIRLCYIQACDQESSHYKRHLNEDKERTTHRHTLKEKSPQRIRTGDCISLRKYSRKYCNNPDNKNCCYPSDVVTRTVKMTCENQISVKNVMFIRACYCPSNCR